MAIQWLRGIGRRKTRSRNYGGQALRFRADAVWLAVAFVRAD